MADSFTGLADKTKQRLREGYSYSINYTDGEIFRQIRLSQFQNDIIGEARWLARLSRTKARDLKALLKRKRLIEALDSILALRGLWSAFKLGSMDVFSTLKCDEVCSFSNTIVVTNVFRRSPIMSHILGKLVTQF